MSERDDIPIPFPNVWSPALTPAASAAPVAPSTITLFLGDLQALVGLPFNGVLPVDSPNSDMKAMVLCFGAGVGKPAGFDMGVVLNQGSVIDLGDDVVDAATNEAALRSIHGVPVEHVDAIVDLVDGTEFEVLRISFANGRQIKIGGPGDVLMINHQPPETEGATT
jgi:hypothetical protein